MHRLQAISQHNLRVSSAWIIRFGGERLYILVFFSSFFPSCFTSILMLVSSNSKRIISTASFPPSQCFVVASALIDPFYVFYIEGKNASTYLIQPAPLGLWSLLEKAPITIRMNSTLCSCYLKCTYIAVCTISLPSNIRFYQRVKILITIFKKTLKNLNIQQYFRKATLDL